MKKKYLLIQILYKVKTEESPNLEASLLNSLQERERK